MYNFTMKIEAMVAGLHTERLAIKECDSEMIQSSGGSYLYISITNHIYPIIGTHPNIHLKYSECSEVVVPLQPRELHSAPLPRCLLLNPASPSALWDKVE